MDEQASGSGVTGTGDDRRSVGRGRRAAAIVVTVGVVIVIVAAVATLAFRRHTAALAEPSAACVAAVRYARAYERDTAHDMGAQPQWDASIDVCASQAAWRKAVDAALVDQAVGPYGATDSSSWDSFFAQECRRNPSLQACHNPA